MFEMWRTDYFKIAEFFIMPRLGKGGFLPTGAWAQEKGKAVKIMNATVFLMDCLS